MVSEERRAQQRKGNRRCYIRHAEEYAAHEKARRDAHMRIYGADGRRLAAARKAKGLYQRDLAALVGVTAGCISMWETGRMAYDPRRFDGIFGDGWETTR